MIDDNNDSTISLIEFIHMFESMEIKITRESIRDLFYLVVSDCLLLFFIYSNQNDSNSLICNL